MKQLIDRILTYPIWEVALEVGVIWLLVYAVTRFVQGTRAAGALKGMLLFLLVATLLVRILGQSESFQRLTLLYDTFLTIAAIALIVVFQPELRRGFIRLGEARFFSGQAENVTGVVESIVDAASYLSKARFGALIVVEREIGLRGLIEGGTTVDATVTSRLLNTIFFPGTALHDLAVIISGDRIEAAGVQLPLADPEDMPDPSLGSRHRAAVGLTKECDAIVIVVSEETGGVSFAERGRLHRGLTVDQLRGALAIRLRGATQQSSDSEDGGDAE